MQQRQFLKHREHRGITEITENNIVTNSILQRRTAIAGGEKRRHLPLIPSANGGEISVTDGAATADQKRDKSLRYRFLFILYPLFLILTSCNVGGAGSFVPGVTPAENNALYDGEPVTGDWVIMNMLDEPESLNPQTSSSASATYVKAYIYESLIQTRREPPYDEMPLLSDGMPEVSSDHLVYRWKIRRDARWHDGKPLTAHDVEFTMKSLMNPFVDNLPSKPYYSELDSVIVEDDYAVTMYCSKPYFMHLEFLGGNSIMPKHVFDAEGLMDGLSYYQVRYGSGFGRIADYLEANGDADDNGIAAGAALLALEKGIESSTEGKVKWEDVEKAGASKDYNKARTYLQSRPEAPSAVRLLQDAYNSAERAWNSLQEVRRTAVRLTEVTTLCRDYATRIQKYGEQFNAHAANRLPTVGSGPYKFDHWTTGQEIVLARNEDYWRGPGHAWLDKIVFRVLTDYTASLVALKNGEIDFMENLQTIQFLTMTNRKKFLDKYVKGTFLIPTYSYIGWQNSSPIFKDKLTRQAMSHLVRKHEVAQKIQFGFSEVVESPFYRYGYDFDSTLKSYKFDVIEAQRLLAEAGWRDADDDGILERDTVEFRFELILPSGSPLGDQVASIMREDMAMVGIDMQIRRLEWSVFINNYIRNHKFDACFLSWVMGLKQDPKQIWHSESAKGRGSNAVEFKNVVCDSLIDLARTEFDRDKRREYYQQFQQIINDEQPYTFMFSSKFKPAYDRRYKGVKWYPYRPGYQLDEWFVPKEEQKYK